MQFSQKFNWNLKKSLTTRRIQNLTIIFKMKKWQDNTENHSRKQQQSLGPRNHTQYQCPSIYDNKYMRYWIFSGLGMWMKHHSKVLNIQWLFHIIDLSGLYGPCIITPASFYIKFLESYFSSIETDSLSKTLVQQRHSRGK